jgi:very-short-patch-repair endonuclease
MTETEQILWSRIRRKQLKGYQFYRQKTIGNYIVDFYCPSARVIIEVDGSQHYEEEGLRKDKERDSYLSAIGFSVLRYPSSEVARSLNEILEDIYDHLPGESPQPPLVKGENVDNPIPPFLKRAYTTIPQSGIVKKDADLPLVGEIRF